MLPVSSTLCSVRTSSRVNALSSRIWRSRIRIPHGPSNISSAAIVDGCRSFVELLIQWELPEHSGIISADIAVSANRILRYLGSALRKPNSRRQRTGWEDMQPAAIAAALSDRACVWDEEQHKFQLPKHVFATRVPFFEPRRRYLTVRDETLEAALDFWGDVAPQRQTISRSFCEI